MEKIVKGITGISVLALLILLVLWFFKRGDDDA